MGSNIGDRRDYLKQALQQLRQLPAIKIIAISSAYRSEAVTLDKSYQEHYLNAVCAIETDLLPQPLLQTLQAIEGQLGRTRPFSWSPRTIDLDLLIYHGWQGKFASLTLPHPHVIERDFVLQPLAEIAPRWRHPTTQKTAQEMMQELAESPGAGKVLACCGSFF